MRFGARINALLCRCVGLQKGPGRNGDSDSDHRREDQQTARPCPVRMSSAGSAAGIRALAADALLTAASGPGTATSLSHLRVLAARRAHAHRDPSRLGLSAATRRLEVARLHVDPGSVSGARNHPGG